MRGTYVFRQQGEIVAVCPNLLTTRGRQEILRYLAGQRPRLAASLGLGHGETTPTLQDSALVLESIRLDIDVTSPDFLQNLVIYKATLPQTTTGRYYEVGVFSNTMASAPSLQPLLTFEDALEDWSVGTHSTDNARLAGETLLVSAGTNTTVSSVNASFVSDLSQYLQRDNLYLSFFVGDENCDSVTIRFRGEVTTNYFQFALTDVVKGYNVAKFSTANLTKVGILDLSQVKSVEVLVKSNTLDSTTDLPGYTGTRVHLDGLSVKSAGADEDILISRALVPATLKTPELPMDVEYYLELTV